MGSYTGQGKGGGNRQHQKKKTPKKPLKQKAYAVTMKNSVPSEVTTTSGGEREKHGTLFPHLCRDGLPKEGLLDNTQNEFQSYNGGDMTCYGHILIDVKDKVTKKYHPIRFYVMNTDVPRILISHAASYWLGLVRVLCDNKATRIKRQVASIDKKSDFRVKSGHFRTSSPNMASSSQKKQTTPKTVTSGKAHVPSPRMHSFEDAKIQGGKTATGVRSGRDVDVSDGEQGIICDNWKGAEDIKTG